MVTRSVFVAFVLLASAASCGTTGGAEMCTDGEAPVDGACVASHPYFQPCSGRVASELPPDDCPTQQCSGAAYAICVDSRWSTCACAVPPGYDLIDAGFFGPDAGSEGGAPEGGAPNDAAADGARDALGK